MTAEIIPFPKLPRKRPRLYTITIQAPIGELTDKQALKTMNSLTKYIMEMLAEVDYDLSGWDSISDVVEVH